MFFFIVRRFLVSIPIVVASTFLVFGLVTISGDPLAEYRTRPGPNREQILAQARDRLNLNQSFPARYWEWLRGVVRFDFGQNKGGQQVYPILKDAMTTTFRLIILATVLSIMIGLVIGIISAVRQYSAFDYGTTFASFLFYSLPVFWLAVLLKQFGAIELNNYLVNPTVSVTAAITVGVITGLVVSTIAGGAWRRRVTALAITAVASVVLLLVAESTDWIFNPGISPLVLAVLAAGAGVVAAMLYAPLSNSRVLLAGVASAVLGLAGSVLFDGLGLRPQPGRRMFLLLAMGVCRRGAWSASWPPVSSTGRDGDARRAWHGHRARRARRGDGRSVHLGMEPGTHGRHRSVHRRPTSAARTGREWSTTPRPPDIAVVGADALIGFATFMPVSRGPPCWRPSTPTTCARRKSKGLPAPQVILRHAFRTALIPVVNGGHDQLRHGHRRGGHHRDRYSRWRGMGTYVHARGSTSIDPYPVMAFLLVVSVSIVLHERHRRRALCLCSTRRIRQ